PFSGQTDLEILQRIIHGTPEPLESGIPQPLRAVVEKALEKDPAERYQSMREMVVDLRRLMRSSSETVPGRSAWLHTRWVGASALLLVVAGIVFLTIAAMRFVGVPHSAGAKPIESLAVLPIENLSHEPEQDYFADGMTDDLITDLAKLSALRVI